MSQSAVLDGGTIHAAGAAFQDLPRKILAKIAKLKPLEG
jgi:hypothetical protein